MNATDTLTMIKLTVGLVPAEGMTDSYKNLRERDVRLRFLGGEGTPLPTVIQLNEPPLS